MQFRTNQMMSLWAVMGILLMVSRGAFAGPDLPHRLALEMDVYFSGNQSWGIWPEPDWSAPWVVVTGDEDRTFTYRVYGLNTDISPVAGVAGIRNERLGANGAGGDWSVWGDGDNGGAGESGGWNVLAAGLPYLLKVITVGPEVRFQGGTYEIETSGTEAHGIVARSVGGNGGTGGWATPALGVGPSWGGNGGAGGSGVATAVDSDGSIRTSGNSSYGILAESQGGKGGSGGWAASSSYSEGGAGGRGGDGGAVNVTAQGSIETAGTSSPGILARSQAGKGGGGGDAGASYGIGGQGGVGGTGGMVHVVSSAHIRTAGASADGISAQSLGGAGGSGGDAGGVVAEGGDTLGSGPGGAVRVGNSGDIETSGRDSRGIFAQSVGGFAGGGGGGGGVVAWGGGGNSAGNGGTVEVTNSGTITVTGGSAETAADREFVMAAIFAQSVGGGGGDAASSGGVVTFGGTGGAGGNGGAVTVTNSGSLQAFGDDSQGILAQSIGAGGGAGGSSGAIYSVGGDGDATGDGRNVTVNNSGAIATGGDRSASIFAQSVGGGGGATGGPGGVSEFGFFGSLGGSGGSGGAGGDVAVHNTAPLETSGVDSSGVLAQSVGGGGGKGGRAFDVGIGFVWVAGGNSSEGGPGGQVSVASPEGSIVTQGALSHGVHALSVGGGGGSGGDTLNFTGGIQASVSVAMGGRGGAGGAGGAVNVASGSPIVTQGEHAHGLYAQSVGGGGGSGGSVVNWDATIGDILGGPGVAIAASIGGTGGDGGKGGPVSVSSTGDISTSAFRSYGVFAQSVGGGGGDGGNSMTGVIAFDAYTLTADLGGKGGAGGNGDTVSVNSGGGIATAGDFAYGILGQSIGGGGGAGGNSTTLLADVGILMRLYELLLPSLDVSSRLSGGGGGGGGGSGGLVETANAGEIVTNGTFSHGILSQSVGGGGGAGGDITKIDIDVGFDPWELVGFGGYLDFGIEMTLGGTGGTGGNGGGVTTRNTGDIRTQGDFANGILAQSVGGGGGAHGSMIRDEYNLINPLGSQIVVRGGSATNGNGGDVIVENAGDIITEGVFSHGILAQSVGGGGGYAGISEEMGISSLALGAGSQGVFMEDTGFGVGFAGSTGGGGSAGAVDVTHTGGITTHGDMSHGILAQSAAGPNGTAGPVSVTLASAITTYGADSDGIRAQSVGGRGDGNISLNLNGIVRGGSGAGAGVKIDGGVLNTFVNTGSISALSGRAIVAGAGDETIHNHGIVTGSVLLGTGANALNNHPGGILNAGDVIDLGTGNALSNAGTLSPGGLGTIMDTTIVGDLVLSAGSVLELEIGGFTRGSFDFIDVTGSVTSAESVLALSSFSPASSPMGTIAFSLLPAFDIASAIGPGQSLMFQFLTAGSVIDWTLMSYSVFGGPSYIRYDVLAGLDGLSLQATHTTVAVPAPGALLLAGIGFGTLGWSRRRMRA